LWLSPLNSHPAPTAWPLCLHCATMPLAVGCGQSKEPRASHLQCTYMTAIDHCILGELQRLCVIDGTAIRISRGEDNLRTGEGQARSGACEETSSCQGSYGPAMSAPFHRNRVFLGHRPVFVVFSIHFKVELVRRSRSLVVF
jgi:hypothetical protein